MDINEKIQSWLRYARYMAGRFQRKGNYLLTYDDLVNEALIKVWSVYEHYQTFASEEDEQKIVKTSLHHHLCNVYAAAFAQKREKDANAVPIDSVFSLSSSTHFSDYFLEEGILELGRLLTPRAFDVLLELCYGTSPTGELCDSDFDVNIEGIAETLGLKVACVKASIKEIRDRMCKSTFFRDAVFAS